MKRDDTILVELPKKFPLARLAAIAKEYGYIYRWSIHNDIMRAPRHFEIVNPSSYTETEPDTGDPT